MKKIYWISAVAIIILGIAAFFAFTAKNKAVEEKAAEELVMTVESVSQSDSFFNINAEYPQFVQADAAFNEKISSLITAKIVQFKKDSQDNWAARIETATPGENVPAAPPEPFDFIAEWQPSQINENYISFAEKLYYYTGGAHGLNEIYTFNYDLKNKKEITIFGFLGNSQENLDKLAKLAKQEVISQLQSQGWPEDVLVNMTAEGTNPTLENFQAFNFTSQALTIYFQQYQVAPGAAGEITVTLYKDTLESNLIFSEYLR